MRAPSMEFGELNVEYGYAYDSAAVVDDGSAVPEPIDDDPGLRAVHPARLVPAPRVDRR